MKNSSLPARRLVAIRLALLALGLTAKAALAGDGPVRLYLHPHGPLAIQSGPNGTRAALGPNDLESFILFRSIKAESATLSSSSPDLPHLLGSWKNGHFHKADGTALPVLSTEPGAIESEATYAGTIDDSLAFDLDLAWHAGGAVSGTLTFGDGSSIPLSGSNFENGRLFLFSKDLRFAASLWKEAEGGGVGWWGYGALDGKGNLTVNFSR